MLADTPWLVALRAFAISATYSLPSVFLRPLGGEGQIVRALTSGERGRGEEEVKSTLTATATCATVADENIDVVKRNLGTTTPSTTERRYPEVKRDDGRLAITRHGSVKEIDLDARILHINFVGDRIPLKKGLRFESRKPFLLQHKFIGEERGDQYWTKEACERGVEEGEETSSSLSYPPQGDLDVVLSKAVECKETDGYFMWYIACPFVDLFFEKVELTTTTEGGSGGEDASMDTSTKDDHQDQGNKEEVIQKQPGDTDTPSRPTSSSSTTEEGSHDTKTAPSAGTTPSAVAGTTPSAVAGTPPSSAGTPATAAEAETLLVPPPAAAAAVATTMYRLRTGTGGVKQVLQRLHAYLLHLQSCLPAGNFVSLMPVSTVACCCGNDMPVIPASSAEGGRDNFFYFILK